MDAETGEESAAEKTGDTGQFAIFGAPTGVQTLTLEVEFSSGIEEFSYSIFIPEEGSVPKYPLLVPVDSE